MDYDHVVVIFGSRVVVGIFHHYTATGKPVLVPLYIIETDRTTEYEKLAKVYGIEAGNWRSGIVYKIPIETFEQFIYAVALLYKTRKKAEDIAKTVRELFDSKLVKKLNELGAILWFRRQKRRYGANDALEMKKILARAVIEIAEKYDIRPSATAEQPTGDQIPTLKRETQRSKH